MAKPFTTWTVLPHGPLLEVDHNLRCVTGLLKMPMGDFTRRMTVARLSDGRLVIYSAIALDEARMRDLEAFGTPSYLVVPNDLHRTDVLPWKTRYPSIVVVAPAGARAKVEEIVPVDACTIDFGDDTVRYVAMPGTEEREAALVVEGAGGTTLVLNDLVFDLANRPGFAGWVLKLIGMTGDEPHIPPVVRFREVKDKDALCAQLEAWSRMPRLRRVIISHGSILVDHPEQTLHRIAAELAA